MVEPWDLKEEEKKAKEKARQAWLTTNGFQVTGLHKSTESDHHFNLLPIGATTEATEVPREEEGVGGGLSTRAFPLNHSS